MHVLQNLEDQDDVDLLIELLASLEWKGGIDLLAHLRRYAENFPIEFTKILQEILLQGYSPEKQTKKSKDPEEKEKDSQERKPNWKRLISQYCTAYPGKDAYEVYNEVPFSFFMEMLPEARRKEARDHIDAAFEASFAMGGSEGKMKFWKKQAGFEVEEEEKANAYQEELSEEELKQERKDFKKDLHG